MEDKVLVRCKREDQATVAGILQGASTLYKDTIKRTTGIDKTVSLDVDKVNFLEPSMTGGVLVMTPDTLIKVDNTLDTRLQLTMSNDLPALRSMLFPKGK